MRWFLALVGLVLLDVALFVVWIFGSFAENCETQRESAEGSSFGCIGIVDAIGPWAVLALIPALGFTIAVLLRVLGSVAHRHEGRG